MAPPREPSCSRLSLASSPTETIAIVAPRATAFKAGDTLPNARLPRPCELYRVYRSVHGLQLPTSGRASAQEAAGTRFRQYGPGDAIRPVDPLDEHAPFVIADEPCETMMSTPASRRWLDEHEERLALKLYRYLLAGRFEAEPGAARW